MKRMRLWAALLGVFFFAGCASGVLVGGGKDDAGQYPSEADARIIHELNRRLMADPQVPAMDVDIDARDGFVTLTGEVPTRAAAERAVHLARTVPGVKDVRNLLRVAR
jgi:osmotically-inducible protein OsmY